MRFDNWSFTQLFFLKLTLEKDIPKLPKKSLIGRRGADTSNNNLLVIPVQRDIFKIIFYHIVEGYIGKQISGEYTLI